MAEIMSSVFSSYERQQLADILEGPGKNSEGGNETAERGNSGFYFEESFEKRSLKA